MSLISLFDKSKSKHIQKPTNFDQLLEDVESVDYIEEYISNKYKFESVLDYSTASNFAIYGSAEEYYRSSIESIYQNYPYDGSAKEKLEWVNKSNPLQIYLFEKEYPRTNGYVRFNPGSSISTISTSGSVNNHRNPTVKEYIFLKGGPHVDNIWNTSSYRSSNLEINGNKGNTVEFWLKKDAFSTSNRREVLLDIWSSSSIPTAADYARYTIELDQQNAAATKSPFVITYRSGSTGVHQAELGSSHLATSASDGEWHHYAITTQNTGSSLSFKVYVDGELDKATLTGSAVGKVDRKLVGVIGALATGKAGRGEAEDPPYNTPGNSNLGWGKLSGSLDEFRYWKTKRSSKEIGRHWFTQVNGGTNTDEANTKLGVYYKFNEGITLTSSIDKAVLDYSGRLTNGVFVGYTNNNRSTDSAIVESGVASSEFKDPIIYTENPRLNKFIDDKKEIGFRRDLSNSSCLIHTMPGWILEEDGERGHSRKLLQILGSYFDVLYAQINKLSTLKHTSYESYDESKPFPFMSQILSSYGLDTTEMFHNATALEALVDKTEEFSFEQKLHNVKNLIYKNLYNSLLTINKSKGTEKAFRNILRTHGVDEELVKLKTYSDNATYEIRPNYDTELSRKRYIDFQPTPNQKGTIFQYSSSFGLGPKSLDYPIRGFITGSTLGTTGLSSTTQAEVIFPHLVPINDNFLEFVPTPVTASLFGAHTVQQDDSTTDLTFRASAKDFASFQVLAAKEQENSRNVRFILKSRSGIIGEQQTRVFRDVYDNTKWNLALRISPSGSNFGNLVSGSNSSYRVELYGVNVDSGQIKNKFTLSQDITKAQGEDFSKFSKRLFVGAHRSNFTGSIIEKSDVKISSVRHWLSYLDDETIRRHAIDPKNYGIKDPYQNAFTLNEGVDNHIPRISTLALHWDFSMVTGSSAGGNLTVQDFSSGSLQKVSQFGDLGQVLAYGHPARGEFFQASSTSSVSLEYVPTYRQKEFENIVSSDMVQVLSNDDLTFTRDSRPINYIFSFEKSMYRTISQEMLDLFATVKDFSSVIGDPLDRYRQSYKPLDKLRALFFESIKNDPDVEKYIEFYRWIDDSLSMILDQYKPASAVFTDGIKNIIESHALERNKYWTKFPTLEFKQSDPEGRILGINELTYDWKHGHAPVPETIVRRAATATLTFTSASKKQAYDDRLLSLQDVEGNTITFESDRTRNVASGALGQAVGNGTADKKVIFPVADVWDQPAKRAIVFANLVNAINSHSGSHVLNISASQPVRDSGVYVFNLTSGSTGQQGNKTYGPVNNTAQLLQVAGTGSSDFIFFLSKGTDTTAPSGQSVNFSGTAQEIRVEAVSGITDWRNVAENFFEKMKLHLDTNTGIATVTSESAASINGTASITIAYNNIAGGIRAGSGRNASRDLDIYYSKPLETTPFNASTNPSGAPSPILRGGDSGQAGESGLAGVFPETTNSGSQESVVTLTMLTRAGQGNARTISSSLPGLTITSQFAGGEGPNIERNQAINCLWWKDRANRKDNRVSTGNAAVDAERETLRRRINTVSSGSTYTFRKLTRPYKLESGLQHVLHGGSNFHLNKKLDFFKGVTNPNSTDYIRVSGSDIDAGEDCDDVHIPKYRLVGGQVFEKKKFRGPADISDTNRDHDISTVLPFSLYSSSIDVPKDYKAEIYKHFKKGVEITNLHDDAYGDDREIPIQGPFTQHHVGGHFHRHIELNRSASLPAGKHDVSTYKTGLDGRSDRREAFFITASDGQLYVLGPDMEGTNFHGQSPSLFKVSLTGTYAGRSHVLRDPLAKRPVNIRNIKTSTSSLNLGNYQHDYQVVFGTSTEMSKDHIVENDKKEYSVDMFLSHSSGPSGFVNVKASLSSEQSSSHFFGFKDRVRPSRKTNKHTITSRFSAPGGPETAGTAHGGPHIDVGTNQYSLYNSMNYRNLTPRIMLDLFSAEKSEAFGHRFLSSVTSSTPSASYHKINRNHRYKAVENGGNNDILVRGDNLFVQHQIPQTDLGYAWIRNSTIETTGSYRRFESDFTDPTGISAQESSSPLFLSASDVGSFKTNLNVSLLGAALQDAALQSSPQSRLLLATKQIIQNDKNRFFDFTPVDLVGLNTIILDKVDEDTDTLGYDQVSKTTVNVGTSISPNKYDLSDYNYINDEMLASNQTVNQGASTTDPSGQMIDGLTGSQGAIGSHLLLNAILSNRGGQFGYPSWKQLRAGEHPIARKHRKNNVMTFAAALGEVPAGLPENADPLQHRRRELDLFAKSEYNWPDSIRFETKTTSRTSENILTRFTESIGTNVRQPIRFLRYYTRDDQGQFQPIPPRNPDGLPTDVTAYTDISFTNLVGNFSNRNLKSFLRLDGVHYQDYLQSFSDLDSVTEANVISYAENIFPKEENMFLDKVRNRESFDTKWWSPNREDRVKGKEVNSQGYFIRTAAKWPLDAQVNFGSTKEISLGTDHPGDFGEGELVSSTGLFRATEGGQGHGRLNDRIVPIQVYPSASATYARRFPETPKTFKIHIKQDGFTYADMSGTHNYSAPSFTISESAQSYRENESEGGSDSSYFGHSLRLADATTLYVAGWAGPASGTNRGRVHKFNYTPDSGDTRVNAAPGIPWVEDLAFELTMSDAPNQTSPANAEFGWHIDTQGDYLAVGAPKRRSSSGPGSTISAGGIYIYKLSTLRNSQHEALILKGEATQQNVGKNLALGKDGTSLIYGMYKSSSAGTMVAGTGKAFIVASGAVGGWQQEAEIVSDDPSTGQYFGREVRFSGSYVAISATGQYVKSNSSDQMVQGGVVHIYKSGSTPVNGSTSGSWAPVCVITSSHPIHTTPRFGASVSLGLGNKHVVIGEPEGIRGGAGAGTGSVQIWRFKDDGTKVHVQTITNPVTTEKNYFGAFVSATPSWISISRPVSGNDSDDNDAEGNRAVLVYSSGSSPGTFALAHTLTRDPNFTSYYGGNTGKWVDAIGNIGGTDVVKNSMHMTVTSDNLPIVIHGLPDVSDSPLHDHDSSPFGNNKGEFRSWYATTSASLNVLREATFYMKPSKDDGTSANMSLITIVPPHHPDTQTLYPNFTMAYIKLSESANSTSKAVDQIVDGLNSYEGNDNFSTGIRFKDIGRARADSDKRTIILEMNESYQNARFPISMPFNKSLGFNGPSTLFGSPITGIYAKGEEFGLNPSLIANMPTTSKTTVPLEDRRQVADAYFSASISNSTFLAGVTKWSAGDQTNRYPFNFKNYEDYAQQIRLIGQNHSIVSEYRISNEMEHYIGTNASDPFYSCPQKDFVAITGSNPEFSDSAKSKFYKVYGHSDFMEHFDFVQEELKDIDSRTNATTVSLTCKGIKKLLPYEGFYPVQRMTQLATLFSQSYGPGTAVMQENYDNTRISMGSFRTALAPFYAPGIGFNSIKSGIAVDYPVFVPKMDRPFIEVCTRFSGSAQDTFTTGALGGRSANRVEIGDGLEWAQVFSGSARSATQISSSAISVSMWIYPEAAGTGEPAELTQIQGTLIQFGDHGPVTGSTDSSKEQLTNGFNFHMSGSNLKLSIRDINNRQAHFSMGSSGSSGDKRKIRVNSWNHVGITLPLGAMKADGTTREPPIFFINGLQFTGSKIDPVSTGSMPNLHLLDIDGYENCSIGNSRSWYTGSYAGREFGPPNAAIAEVCIFNRKLQREDVHGLYGSGSRYRGPWRPDMSVRPRMRNSLVGWYRMGNDTGVMTLSGTIANDANRTNRKRMSNKAWVRYSRKHRLKATAFGRRGSSYLTHNTGSEHLNQLADHGFEYTHGNPSQPTSDESRGGLVTSSLSYAKFRGFTGNYGIVTVNSIDSTHELTGAFKYPSYITGSEFNETADSGIPRIGSASWANHTDSDQDQTLTTWQRVGQGNDKYGIQRIERIPFEAIVDPYRSLFTNEMKEVTEGQFDRRFTLYETEPHPSASLQPCSFARYQPGPYGYIGKQAYQDRFTLDVKKRDFRSISVSDAAVLGNAADDPVGGYAFFGMPNTSSMMTSSFNLTAMSAIGETKYSKAANNFYAEVMNFFLENGHSTVIASADTPQRPIEFGRTYKMRIIMSRQSDRKDFPLYNLPQAFGPPVDASSKLQASNVDAGEYVSNFAHGYSGYTPPHFDSFAEVEYSFTPDEGENYEMSNPGAIESILTRIAIDNKTSPTIKFNRFIKATGSMHPLYNDVFLSNSPLQRVVYSGPTDSSMTDGLSPVTSSLNKSSAMQMSASFRGLGLDDASFVSTFDNNDPNSPIIRKSLSIQAKWECPNLDFKGVDTVKAFHPGLSVPKGMWHQIGNANNPVTFVSIRPPTDPNDGDLAELLGMHFKVGGQDLNPVVKQRSIGVIQDRKIISEAVVAIPFVEREDGSQRFLEFNGKVTKRIYEEVKNTPGFSLYREWDLEIQSDLRRSEREQLEFSTNNFVSTMVKTMIEHVIPPKFNFLKYNDERSGKYIKPFMMYCFPFTHTLTKEDLGHIWQNLSPDIALDTYYRPGDEIQQEVRSIHAVADTPLNKFIEEGRMSEIKWMVFKVKKKAENNYFEKMDIDRLPINHPERNRAEKDLFEYGFNWPYDFFSLVELIKVDARVVLDKNEKPIVSPGASPLAFERVDPDADDE